ncbi:MULTISPECIES: hypothetical protein [unclassified Gordonia (in: high G+C Gram-positive bacteria)]|uniref:hypothetical protein n=1 Tax=unclassified Gordonia (in: high G+C Gram-positive bacteria) TaxID=2657482 RepID=UPI00200033FB|nr:MULTISPECIES: hypothetical protein [unclassified Gordonia (in: high G+C Gram-positive bacteria)]UQE75491.1 hypothetical protein MYK68_02380 [Gordonia sp. PP30]
MMTPIQHPQFALPTVQVVVLDDPAAHDYARRLAATGARFGVIGARSVDVVPYLTGATGNVVALIADADDPAQLADAVSRVEDRLQALAAVVRHRRDPLLTDGFATRPHRDPRAA